MRTCSCAKVQLHMCMCVHVCTQEANPHDSYQLLLTVFRQIEMRNPARTHAHARAHARAHTHARTPTLAHTLAHICNLAPVHTSTPAHICTQARRHHTWVEATAWYQSSSGGDTTFFNLFKEGRG